MKLKKHMAECTGAQKELKKCMKTHAKAFCPVCRYYPTCPIYWELDDAVQRIREHYKENT